MYSRAPCFEYSLGFVQRWSVGMRVHRGLPINVIFYKWHIGTCIFMIVFLLQDIYFLNNAYGYIFFLRCTCRLIGGKSRSIQQSKHLLIPNTLNNIAVRLLFSILESPILRINNIVPYCEGHGTLFPLDNLHDTFNMLYLTWLWMKLLFCLALGNILLHIHVYFTSLFHFVATYGKYIHTCVFDVWTGWDDISNNQYVSSKHN